MGWPKQVVRIQEGMSGSSNLKQSAHSEQQQHVLKTSKDMMKNKVIDGKVNLDQSIFQVLAGVWIVGILLLGFYAFRNQRVFFRKLAKSIQVKDEKVISVFEQCKRRLLIKRVIPLIQSDHNSSPAVLGYFQPKILLPKHVLNDLNHEQLHYIFLHELAHVKRNDVGINRIMNIILIVHWFNPVLWYAYQRMREDQEAACDAFVLNVIGPREINNYGHTMITILESVTKLVSFSGATNLFGTKKQLMRRIQMLNQFKRNSHKWSVLGIVSLLVVGGLSLTNGVTATNVVNDMKEAISRAQQDAISVQKDVQKDVQNPQEKTLLRAQEMGKGEKGKDDLINIYAAAKEGKVLGCEFKLGVKIHDIEEKLGKGEAWAEEGSRSSHFYSSQGLGFNVYDPTETVEGLLSFDTRLRKLPLSEVKKELGAPDRECAVREYYQVTYDLHTKDHTLLTFNFPLNANSSSRVFSVAVWNE